MDAVYKIIERVLGMLLVSFFLSVAIISYLTGKFPPSREDIKKVVLLSRALVSTSQQMKAIEAGLMPDASLEQVLEFQKLALQRTQITLDMLNIMKRIKPEYMNPSLDQKLHQIEEHLASTEHDMAEVQKMIEPSLTNQ